MNQAKMSTRLETLTYYEKLLVHYQIVSIIIDHGNAPIYTMSLFPDTY